MTVELANEIWSELKRYVNTVDRDDAAETLVSVLIDNDVGPDEIKAVFKSDSDIKKALASYLSDHDETEDEEEIEDDDYNEDDDWEN
jgi:uncharacterized UBP type Zn finger protein